MRKLVLLIAALALLATGCGGSEDDAAALPVNDGADDPAIDAACLDQEPECDDTPTGEPQDLPRPSDGDGQPVAVLSVTEALAASGRVAVTGFLVDNNGEAKLCEALAESFPPQCGEAGIPITGYDQIDIDDLQTDGAVTWTDQVATIFGEVVDGTLVADSIE
jgi:hypothetical protein